MSKTKTMKFIYKSKTKQNHKNSGFTLTEMVVSLGVLGIVLIIVSTFFATSIRAQRVVLSEKAVAENINYAIEFMSRQMRTAQRYNPDNSDNPENCFGDSEKRTFPDGPIQRSSIRFINQYQQCVEFALATTTEDIGFIQMTRHVDDPSSPDYREMQLTTPYDINIERMDFFIRGEQDDDDEQPRVTLVIEARGARGISKDTTLRVQTSVTARGLDTP